MKTDDLIDLLSTNVPRANPRRTPRIIAGAVAAGAATVAVAVLVALGRRPGLADPHVWLPVALKIAFSAVLLVPAAALLVRLARPGGRARMPAFLLVLLFAAVIVLAGVSLSVAPGGHWRAMVLGNQWLECLLSIPIIAVVPFAVIVWAVRQSAPTDLPAAGAVAGLVAGCLSAAGYALHCVDDSVPFVAVWYGGTIALCALAGWLLGPRLLRW